MPSEIIFIVKLRFAMKITFNALIKKILPLMLKKFQALESRKNTPELSKCVNDALVESYEINESSKNQVKDCVESAEKFEDTVECSKNIRTENVQLNFDVLKRANKCVEIL